MRPEKIKRIESSILNPFSSLKVNDVTPSWDNKHITISITGHVSGGDIKAIENEFGLSMAFIKHVNSSESRTDIVFEESNTKPFYTREILSP